MTFWGADGQKLGTWTLSWYSTQLIATNTGANYFAGRLIKKASGYVAADLLGSIGKFYPYGQEKPSATTNGTEKFTGYLRDSETGLDYAVNRYHMPGQGRFLTADQSQGSANGSSPGSWNRYAYVQGDPINGTDPTGLVESIAQQAYASCLATTDSEIACGGMRTGGSGEPGGGGGCGVGILNFLYNTSVGVDCEPPPPPPPVAAQPSCNDTEAAYLGSYLAKRGSPLADYAGSIVTQSDLAGVDDRFILALAGAESTYGKNTSATWGQYNTWSDSQHCAILSGDCQNVNPFSNWSQAISAAIANIIGKNYFGATPALTTTDAIYEKYSSGGSPALLNTIYLNQMGGGLIPGKPKQVNFSRCTN